MRKHSRADAADIAVVRSPTLVTLTVTDNGRGLGDYSPAAENGFGLAGMRDRVTLVGGRLEVRDGVAGGTVLRVTVPAPADAPVAPLVTLADTPVGAPATSGGRG